ncbi:nuclease-related domain-containing protein [Streptomyces sp. AS02]|uniref:nuclease-related domain-containing protein n=1 Tax=Streptomyces sp. AS02 TaxID=2938946 RepID=UPI002020901F|nr:nuclease-related domain-containing protein [Streptomyces sp. AS02]MCL8016904.1 NERD domain-containing protein [Streptomyces sp. AS02]
MTAALGVSPAARRADAQAALWDRGAEGEAATASLLAQLRTYGWEVRHDVRLPGRRFNLDHVLISPCGTAVVVLDTKVWHRGWTTDLVRGRVHCGVQDRHEQVEKVAGYASAVQAALGLRSVVVWPLLVVHGSPIAGGRLEVRVPGWDGVVHVLGPDYLVPTLATAPKVRDVRRAAAVVARVDSVLRPYGEGG